MKGDFSRGFSPDRKRGKRYRRVLPQQRTLLLDSDFAAMVDAVDTQVRGVATDLGYQQGSPDLGYLITPGRLLAVFDRPDLATAVSAPSAGSPPPFFRDFRRKYLGRYPSLGVRDAARIRLVAPLVGAGAATRITLWLQADATTGVRVEVDGIPEVTATQTAATDWTSLSFDLAIPSGSTVVELVVRSVAVGGNPAQPFWIGLVEQHEDRAVGPHFWAAAGRFHQRGLVAELAAPGGFPDVSFPTAAGFPVTDTELANLGASARIVAYLESWERAISHIEDPGIRDVAIGDGQSALRTQVVGQVKWANAGALTPAQLAAAFTTIKRTGTLDVAPAEVVDSGNPCALPLPGGYSGPDHRLYRFEVHTPGALGAAVLTWSRDNGSELFTARLNAETVKVARGSVLADGDLVELISDVVDLGDDDPATVAIDGVEPARRHAGVLAYLKAERSDEEGYDVFSLLDPADPRNFVFPATTRSDLYGPGVARPFRLRRWHGLLRTTAPASGASQQITLEDGIKVTLEGTFQVGDWWQHEARRGAPNSNGSWQRTAHGPERLLTPLAILQRVPDATRPLALVAWLDRRFPSFDRVEADDIPFDGTRVGNSASTVQEALERLLESGGSGGCCDTTIRPQTGVDDGARIRAVIEAANFPADGEICLQAGVYEIQTSVVVTGRSVTIRGCPDCVIVNKVPTGPAFQIGAQGRLRLDGLTLFSGSTATADVLVELGAEGRFAGRNVALLAAGRSGQTISGIAIRTPSANPFTLDTNASDDTLTVPGSDAATGWTYVELEDSVVLARHAVVGNLMQEMTAERTALYAESSVVSADTIKRLQLVDSALVTGLATTVLSGLTPDGLRGQLAAILDLAAATAPAAGHGVAATKIRFAEVSGSSFGTNMGIFARLGQDLHLHGNRYRTASLGEGFAVRISHAQNLQLIDESIRARYALHVPLSASGVVVRGCRITGRDEVIAIGGEVATVSNFNVGDLVDIVVESNQVASQRTAIVVGMANALPARLERIRIANNVVTVTNDQSLSDGNGIALACVAATTSEADIARAVVVDGNEVTSALGGISLRGSSGIVRGNRVVMKGRLPAIRTAQLSASTPTVIVVVDNVIERITAASGGSPLVAAILADGCFDLRAHRNHTRGPSNTDLAVQVTNTPSSGSVTISDCDLVGNVEITNGNGAQQGSVVVRESSLNDLKIDNFVAGVVMGNALNTSITIRGAKGTWCVERNLCSNALSLSVTQPSALAGPSLSGGLVELAETDRMTSSPAAVIEGLERWAVERATQPLRDVLAANPGLFLTALPVTAALQYRMCGNVAASLTLNAGTGSPVANSSVQVVDNRASGASGSITITTPTMQQRFVHLNISGTAASINPGLPAAFLPNIP